MDFRHTEDQLAFYKSVKDFAGRVVEPGAHERDVEGRFDRDVWDIGVFTDSIGELEPILRDEFSALQRLAVDPSRS